MTVHPQNLSSTERRILRFLDNHPDAPVTVVVGFASVWGLAWLNDNTKGRKVNLLIGDARQNHFAKSSESNKRNAVNFLRRTDVNVSNWYRRGNNPSEIHMKAWLIETPAQSAALVGSANLTKKGIRQNQELMVEASGSDLNYSINQIKKLMADSWTCQDRLVGYLDPASKQPATSENSGCLGNLALACLGVLSVCFKSAKIKIRFGLGKIRFFAKLI